MREIKFRAWCKNSKTMYYEDVTSTSCIMNRFSENLMQYTGLKDKNGKKIYEGDIVKRRKNYIDDNDKFSVYVVEYHCGQFLLTHNSGYRLPISNTKEVIGNIYENPELLNE